MQAGKLKIFLALFVQIARCRELFSGGLRRKLQEVIKMTRLLPLLLALALLAGYGAMESKAPAAKESSFPAEEPAPVTVSEDFRLTTEWAEYDPSVETVWYLLENRSGGEIMTGRENRVERLAADGTWQALPMKENAAWTMEGLMVPNGETIALNCWLGMYDHDFCDGTYRIVKEVEGQICAAEFRMKEGAAISAEAPYGFGSLEDLPRDYGAALAAENDMVFTNEGVKNGEALETFLHKVSLDIPCQLRTVQDYGEGAVMVIDTVYEYDCFLWRMWNGGDEATQERYSYLVTDGTDLYLSNGTDWETAERYANKELAWLVPAGTADSAAVETVDAMTAKRLESNTARYRVWSADGVWDACLTENPTEFGVGWRKEGEGSGGKLYDVSDWGGQETAIWGLEWQEDGKLLLFCETADGGSSRLTFDPARETLQ